MPVYRCQFEIPYDSGLPEDKVVNVWHCTAPDPTEAADFIANVIGFYQSIDEHFSAVVNASTDACSVKAYNLDDPIPRAPEVEDTFTLADATGGELPLEVAICLSFQGDQISGQPQARRRGRIYLGPLETGVVDLDGFVATAVHQDIATAAGVLLAASGLWDWVVYSPTEDTSADVTNGWVDNEFDTQRRRGRVATARSTF